MLNSAMQFINKHERFGLMEKIDVIRDINFGRRTAEEESDELMRYFVETENWRKVWEDEVDLIFAPKGGGKSAIYQMLLNREDSLVNDRKIHLLPADKPQGNSVFQLLKDDNDLNEEKFERIWTLYFLALAVSKLEDLNIKDSKLKGLRKALDSAGLSSAEKKSQNIMQRIREAFDRVVNGGEIVGPTFIDPATSTPISVGSIKFGVPTSAEASNGLIDIQELYEDLEEVLKDRDINVWILLDRLDVAFSTSPELERIALRALFRTYSNLKASKRLSFKIFLRTDIWKSVAAGGFRELSHMERELKIGWDRATMRALLVRRLLLSKKLQEMVELRAEDTLESGDQQEKLLQKIYPDQVEPGDRKRPTTLDWVLSRIEDGKEVAVPRELIHMYSEARDSELRRIENGQSNLPGDKLFESQAFKEDAWPEVSRTRLSMTIYAEYADVTEWLELLKEQKTEQDAKSLSQIWGITEAEAAKRRDRLIDIGFFKDKKATVWVPFLYRPALKMIQGAPDDVNARKK